MRIATSVSILAAVLTLTAAGARAETDDTLPAGSGEESWASLVDDPSRTILFDENIVAAKLQEQQESGATPDPSIDLSIPSDFVFPDDVTFDKAQHKARVNAIFGIDVSHYTGTKINFALLKLQRIKFVYTKATQGVRYKDDMFAVYWPKLDALPASQKVLRGAYHFLSSHGSGTDQANRFVDYVNLHGGFKPGDMPPCLDLEWDRTAAISDQWEGRSADDILKNALDALAVIKQRTGRTPVLYTARSWWHDRGIPESKIELFKDYTIWIADYSKSHKAVEKPSVPLNKTPQLWQFASDAKLTTGYRGGLDANIFYGTDADFDKAFGITN